MVMGTGESDVENEPQPRGFECPVQLSQTLLDPEVYHRKFYCPPFVSLVLPKDTIPPFGVGCLCAWVHHYRVSSERSYPHFLTPHPKFCHCAWYIGLFIVPGSIRCFE